MNLSIQEQIQTILKQRATWKPKAQQRISQWQALDAALSGIEKVASTSKGINNANGLADTIVKIPEIRSRIEKRIDRWKRAETRFSRKTVNIGVGGQMKVGKSTLLQKISGLNDNEIPTHFDECTAVRSRIFHAAEKKAVVYYHNWDSFREKVLAPIYKLIAIADSSAKIPNTIDQLDSDQANLNAHSDKAEVKAAQMNLMNIKASLPSFKDSLTGKIEEVPMSKIRELVAKPTVSEERLSDGRVQRKYLAVRQCEIYTTFPRHEVSDIGLIDLPGLGSLIQDVDRHNTEGIQNDIDLVFMMKRPTDPKGGITPWNQEDQRALLTLSTAGKELGVKKAGDFLILVVNGSDPERVADLKYKMENEANRNNEYQIWDVNAMDEDDVRNKILKPGLAHLALKLPNLDDELLAAEKELDGREIHEISSDLEHVIGSLQSSAKGHDFGLLINELAENLCGELAIRFNRIELQYLIRKDQCETEVQRRFKAEMAKLTESLKNTWIKTHFSETWTAEISREIAKDNNVLTGVRVKAMHACRADLRVQFALLDTIFQLEMNRLWQDFGKALQEETGALLSCVSGGEDTIRLFQQKCETSGRRCDVLSKAARSLLAPKITLHVNFLHRVVEGMEQLAPTDQVSQDNVTPSLGGDKPPITLDLKTLVDTLRNELKARCLLAIQRTSEAILKDVRIVDAMLYSFANHFNDQCIRSPQIKKEYHAFIQTWGEDIDKDQYAAVANGDRFYKQAQDVIKTTRLTLAQLTQN